MEVYEIFKELQGTWLFQRTLKSRNVDILLGTVHGIAAFTSSFAKDTLLYKEEGEFTISIGEKFKAYREYFYIYNQLTDKIQKNFSVNGNNTGLFYFLSFQQPMTQKNLAATGEHLCRQDLYEAAYQFFKTEGVEGFNKFTLAYRVKGPNKNYVMETIFERSKEES